MEIFWHYVFHRRLKSVGVAYEAAICRFFTRFLYYLDKMVLHKFAQLEELVFNVN